MLTSTASLSYVVGVSGTGVPSSPRMELHSPKTTSPAPEIIRIIYKRLNNSNQQYDPCCNLYKSSVTNVKNVIFIGNLVTSNDLF